MQLNIQELHSKVLSDMILHQEILDFESDVVTRGNLGGFRREGMCFAYGKGINHQVRGLLW